MSQQPHVLMCPPDYYGIEYEINPWMNTERQADHPTAVAQWSALRQAILAAGAQVCELTPVEGLPDLVFTANAAMVFGKQAVLSRFRHSQRQGEEPHNHRWLAEHGFEVLDPPVNFSFEGAGDALFCGDTLYAGYRMRSDAAGHQAIGRMLGVRVIPVELVDPRYYHLDIALGSQGEVEVQLEIARRVGFLREQDYRDLQARVEEVGRMLNGLMSSIQRGGTQQNDEP